MTFGNLPERDTFIVLDTAKILLDEPLRLLMKIKEVPSKRTPGLVYNAQDHVTGSLETIPADTEVVRVAIAEESKRP